MICRYGFFKHHPDPFITTEEGHELSAPGDNVAAPIFFPFSLSF